MDQKPIQVALLGLNSQYIHSSLAPWCLRAGLSAYARAPFSCLVVEGSVNEAPEAVLVRLVQAAPQVLGISCYIWNIAFVEGLLPLVRAALPDCTIILGGPEVSFRPADALKCYPQADYVLCGEGELPFAKLVDALQGFATLKEVPGLCWRTSQGVHLGTAYAHENMQPTPYDQVYLDQLDGRIAYLETSRGCPYSCAFCLSGRGEKLRQLPLDRAFSQLVLLANSGAKTIKLVDRTFNADKKRAREILAFLIREQGLSYPQGITFHFEIAGDLLDEATLSLLETAPLGLFQFEIGLQSMDESTLRLVRRRTDMATLKAGVGRLIRAETAHVHLDLIAGLPGEGLKDFALGFDQAYALRPHALQLGFLKLIHGSAMREEPTIYPCDFDPKPPYRVLSTPHLSQADFLVLATVERALDKVHNFGRFQATLAFITQEAGISPFALFLVLGEAILEAEKAQGSLPLDALTNLVAQVVFHRYPALAPRLQDTLLLDRLASVKTTVLPEALKQNDARYHRVKRALALAYPRPGEGPRSMGFLYQGEERVVWCDYEARHPVTGLYPLHEVPVSKLLGV